MGLYWAKFNRKKENPLAAGAAFLVVAGGALGWALGREAGLLGALVLAAAAIAALAVKAHCRAQRYREAAWQDYKQVEALFSIFSMVQLNAPLPPARGEAIASPDFIKTVLALIQEHRPSRILELGSGLSTLVEAYYLKRVGGGRVVSVDHEERYAALTRANLEIHGVADAAEVVCAPLGPLDLGGETWIWYDAAAFEPFGKIDLLIIDGPKASKHNRMARYPALPVLYDRLSESAIVILDDGRRPGEAHVVERWLQEFPDLEARFLPTEKGAFILRKKSASEQANRRI